MTLDFSDALSPSFTPTAAAAAPLTPQLSSVGEAAAAAVSSAVRLGDAMVRNACASSSFANITSTRPSVRMLSSRGAELTTSSKLARSSDTCAARRV